MKKERLDQLNNEYHVDCVSTVNNKYDEVLERIKDYHALHAISLKVDQSIIDAGKSLELISNYGVGYDNIDVGLAASRGISVANTPVSTSKATAEYTIGLMIALLRNIALNDRRLRSGKLSEWSSSVQTGYSLRGKQLGILGMGRIGKEVALIAQSLGMKVCYHNRNALQSNYLATYLSLEELFKSSDILSIHAPSTPETHHILDAKRIALMKNSAWIINTARGNLIDHDALISGLKEKKIMGAALDVFPNEPNIPSALLKMDNVLLSPHNGTGTFEDRAAMFQESFANIVAFFEGRPMSGKVC